MASNTSSASSSATWTTWLVAVWRAASKASGSISRDSATWASTRPNASPRKKAYASSGVFGHDGALLSDAGLAPVALAEHRACVVRRAIVTSHNRMRSVGYRADRRQNLALNNSYGDRCGVGTDRPGGCGERHGPVALRDPSRAGLGPTAAGGPAPGGSRDAGAVQAGGEAAAAGPVPARPGRIPATRWTNGSTGRACWRG